MDNRFFARIAAVAVGLSALVPVAVVGLLMFSLATLPPPERLPRPLLTEGGQLSRIYDVHGEEIGQFSEFEQNIPVKKRDIPKVLKQAVVAAEDKNFYSHGGIDMRAIFRAVSADLQGGELSQGGSTITQQYVKNAYTGNERSFGRKVREAILASQFDRKVDKEEILFRYLSSVYLGEGAYGVGAASETYFRKPVNKLTLSEAALLAGLIPAPSRYEPRGNPGSAEQKRTFVLDSMLEEGFITPDEHARASAERIWSTAYGRPNRPVTLVYSPQQQATRYPYFVDYVRRYLEEKLGRDAVYRGGLRIRTTLDPKMQANADKAVADALAGTSPPIDMALVAVEPRTGFVRAMVGGRDFNAPGGQVNLALGRCTVAPERLRGKVDVPATCWDAGDEKNDETVAVGGGGTGRQPGSSWKPFVLAAALHKGIPDTKVYSAPSSYRIPGCRGDTGCVIRNYEGSGGGRATLRQGTVKSYNTVYAQVIRDVGVPEVGEMAKKLGITSAWVANPEVHGPSYALGAQEVSPLDMASAYGVFANNGMRVRPTPIEWIRDFRGKYVEDNRRTSGQRVLPDSVASTVTDILRGVITGGTGTRADIGRPAAGKTGTAQEWRDAWFIGYTPQLSTSVWIGNKLRPTPLNNIKGLEHVFGGSIPAETWKAFMLEAVKDLPPEDFVAPYAATVPPPAPVPTYDSPPDASSRTTTTQYDPYGPSSPYPTGPPVTETTYPPYDFSTTTTTSFTTTTTQPSRGLLFSTRR